VHVPYGEGAANHTGPEPCADVRKGVGEAWRDEHSRYLAARSDDDEDQADAPEAVIPLVQRARMWITAQYNNGVVAVTAEPIGHSISEQSDHAD